VPAASNWNENTAPVGSGPESNSPIPEVSVTDWPGEPWKIEAALSPCGTDTDEHAENSDVLPAGSVAVAVTTWSAPADEWSSAVNDAEPVAFGGDRRGAEVGLSLA